MSATPSVAARSVSESYEALRAALRQVVGDIVEATRAGHPYVDDMCDALSGQLAESTIDAIATAYLRAGAEIEQHLNLPRGAAN